MTRGRYEVEFSGTTLAGVCVCVCVFEVDVSTEQTSTRACLQDSFKILSHCPGCEIGSNIVLGSKNLR
jgi:hypothetical protein